MKLENRLTDSKGLFDEWLQKHTETGISGRFLKPRKYSQKLRGELNNDIYILPIYVNSIWRDIYM